MELTLRLNEPPLRAPTDFECTITPPAGLSKEAQADFIADAKWEIAQMLSNRALPERVEFSDLLPKS